jgi:hypothetical protein
LQLDPAYYYWFLVKNDKPMLCLSADGVVFSRDGKSHDLMTQYQKQRGVWRLIAEIAVDLLP